MCRHNPAQSWRISNFGYVCPGGIRPGGRQEGPPIISNTREQCTGKVTLVGRGFQGTSNRRRLKAGCALQRHRRGLFVELPPSRSRKLRQERHMPKMSLLTELWIVGLRGLQRCHAYGVSGKPPMHQGFLGTMHHPWWLVSPAEPFPEGKAPLERRPTCLPFW